jgi:hypothetical protein
VDTGESCNLNLYSFVDQSWRSLKGSLSAPATACVRRLKPACQLFSMLFCRPGAAVTEAKHLNSPTPLNFMAITRASEARVNEVHSLGMAAAAAARMCTLARNIGHYIPRMVGMQVKREISTVL